MLELSSLLERLNQCPSLDVAPRELAEALWLANEIKLVTTGNSESKSDKSSLTPSIQTDHTRATPVAEDNNTSSPNHDTVKESKNTSLENPSILDTPFQTEPSIEPQPIEATTGHTGEKLGMLPLALTEETVLPNLLELERALRPLKRRVPTVTEWELDEEKTANRIVDEQIWLPVFKPLTNRWLELALVIDHTASMVVWQQTITQLEKLLTRLGAFRLVKRWYITVDKNNHPILHLNTPNGPPQKANNLVDQRGQRVVMFITDAIHTIWEQQHIYNWVNSWGYYQPVVMLQLLPEYMWPRTALGLAKSIYLQVQQIGAPNQQYSKHFRFDESKEERDKYKQDIGLPVITLDPYSIGQWVRAMINKRRPWLNGVLLPSYPIPSPKSNSNTSDITATERLAHFRSTASSTAWKLAGLLSGIPLTLPVMRFIQQKMLPNSSPLHLAEIFLGGILKRASPPTTGLEPDEVVYDFYPGIRAELLGTTTLTDISKVQALATDFIHDSVNQTPNIIAYLNPKDLTKSDVVLNLNDFVENYPKTQQQLLEQMGGIYKRLAKEKADENHKQLEQFFIISDESGKQQVYRYIEKYIEFRHQNNRSETQFDQYTENIVPLVSDTNYLNQILLRRLNNTTLNQDNNYNFLVNLFSINSKNQAAQNKESIMRYKFIQHDTHFHLLQYQG